MEARRPSATSWLRDAGFCAFIVLALIGLSPPALVGGADNPDLVGGGSALVQIVHLALALLSMVVFASGARWTGRVDTAMIVALAWCSASLMWAQVPGDAARRVVLLDLIVATAALFMTDVDGRWALRLLSATIAWVVILDLIAVPLLPGAVSSAAAASPGTEVGAGWRGLHVDKNLAGSIAAISIIVSVFQSVSFEPRGASRRALWVIAAAISVFFLLGSGSKTSLALVPLSMLLAVVLLVFARMRAVGCLAALVPTLLLAVLLAASPALQTAIANAWRDVLADPRSFTGRSQIWQAVLDFSAQRPWLGYGFGSFWQVGDRGPLFEYATGYRAWIRTVPNSHNGYLDLLIQVGWIGLVLGVLAAIVVPLAKLILYRDMPADIRWLCGAITIFFALHNLLEATLFGRDGALWTIQVINILVISTYRPQWTWLRRIGPGASTRFGARRSAAA